MIEEVNITQKEQDNENLSEIRAQGINTTPSKEQKKQDGNHKNKAHP